MTTAVTPIPALLAALAVFASAVVCAATAIDPGLQIVREGNGKGAAACESCHGPTGMGNAAAGFPRLAGLDAAYLVRQLNDYENGTRTNPIMSLMAKTLSPQDRSAVARYYAALPVTPQPAPSGVDQAVLVRGQRIVQEGVWSKGVPACVRCHGVNGEGIPPHFPSIIAQPATYVVAQFAAWQDGARANDPIGLMKSVATKLDQDEIAAAAAWLATLGPVPAKPQAKKAR